MVTAIVMIAQIIYTSGYPQYKEQETLLDEQQFTMSEQLNAMMDKHRKYSSSHVSLILRCTFILCVEQG
jgi:hypothetical protein